MHFIFIETTLGNKPLDLYARGSIQKPKIIGSGEIQIYG